MNGQHEGAPYNGGVGWMNIKSQLFDRIRVAAQRKESAEEKTAVRHCAYPGCVQHGLYPALAKGTKERVYIYFCLEHVRLYNSNYDFFSGMSNEAIAKYQKEAAVGHRPTWHIGSNTGAQGKEAGSPNRIKRRLSSRSPSKDFSAPTPKIYSPAVVKALQVLDLHDMKDINKETIKIRYKDLVKRLHPDANGGDRSNEERLREIIRAYNFLKLSRFV